MVVGERHVPFEACFNFRDIGGYDTVDGRRVRWGAVYRSDALHRLTTTDLERALELGVRTVIDLRSSAELDETGRFGRAEDVAFHHLPLFEQDTLPPEPPNRDQPQALPGETYVEMATSARGALASAIRVLAEGEHAVVFHCTAGKDRTGVLAALILSGLGVPDDAIVADYHLSERSLAPALAWAEANEPEWAERMATMPPWMLRAPTEVMQAFLDTLRDRHGTVDGYLVHAGVDRELLDRLRTRLLEP